MVDGEDESVSFEDGVTGALQITCQGAPSSWRRARGHATDNRRVELTCCESLLACRS